MTKGNTISPGYLRNILRYDPDSGKLFWLTRSDVSKEWNTRYAGKEAGTPGIRGYPQVSINCKRYSSHRLAWAIYYGKWPDNNIDHINGHRSDNRISNLREATYLQNSWNRPKSPRNTSGFKGVSWHSQENKWRAEISYMGKTKFLGLFIDPKEAHYAYCAASIRMHGEFSRTS